MNLFNGNSPVAPIPNRLVPFLLRAVARCIVVVLSVGLSFAGIAYLRVAQPVSGRQLLVDLGATSYAIEVAVACQIVMFGVAIASELAFWSVRGQPRLVHWLTSAIPLAWLLVGSLIFYPQPEHGPKETMLVTGGGLAALLGSGVFLWLWYWMERPHEPPPAPALWYVLVFLVVAAFIGSLQAWTGPSPRAREVLEYRARHWSNDHEQPTANQVPDDVFIRR